MTSSNGNIFRVTGPLWGEFTGYRWIPLTKASDMELRCFLWSATEQTIKANNQDAGDLRRHRAHYDITVMHISSVIKISFYSIAFSRHQNKFCACLDSIYRSRVILVMRKNCSDISWHQLNLNQSKMNCPKNLNSDGLIIREMGPWPYCIFRSLLQFLMLNNFVSNFLTFPLKLTIFLQVCYRVHMYACKFRWGRFGSIILWGHSGWGRFGWGRFCEAVSVIRSGWGCFR